MYGNEHILQLALCGGDFMQCSMHGVCVCVCVCVCLCVCVNKEENGRITRNESE